MINIFIIHYFVPIKNVFMQFGADHIMLVVGSCYHGLMRGGCWLILTVTDVKSPPPLPWSPLVSTGLHWWPWYSDWRLSVSSLSQVKCWHCHSLITSTTIMYIYNIQSSFFHWRRRTPETLCNIFFLTHFAGNVPFKGNLS